MLRKGEALSLLQLKVQYAFLSNVNIYIFASVAYQDPVLEQNT